MIIDYIGGEINGVIKRKIKTPKVVREINSSNGDVKLVIGAGNSPLDGWYNFDLRSRVQKCII